MFTIDFFTLPNGKQPVKDFICSLNVENQVKAIYSLELLKEFGNSLREPYSKFMGDGLFELRIRFKNDISRIFYFFCCGNRIILTNGFVKKTNKTPRAELEKAKRYKNDYEKRHKDD